ncbi:hypothetical protein EBS80_02380 [bacterium]|nr:hypothetical protein [bacterium]
MAHDARFGALLTHIENDEPPNVRWNRTDRVLSRVEWQLTREFVPGYGMCEFFKGHHVIGRDRPITRGIYLGSHAREAIVVTDDPSMLRAYHDLRRRLGRVPWRLGEPAIIRAVHDFVRERMPGGRAETRTLLARVLPDRPGDEKIALSVFVENGAGVCRHRPLFGAYLVEKLIRDRVLFGRVSIDRAEDDQGGHAWMRYVSRWSGRILISDPAIGPCGELFSLREEWSYLRPGDVRPAEANPLLDPLDHAIMATGLLWLIWRYL